ncbi:MAG: histone deacetylase family protein [Chromatiales bacterium]|nr:histone deacetylase family protein [Chromatiales bacterium]
MIALISHEDCALHQMGLEHPEQPARLDAIHDRLISSNLSMVLFEHDAPLATREQLERAHDPEYVAEIFAVSPKEGSVWLDGDTSMNPHSLNAALRAAGAAVHGVDLVMHGPCQVAFCNVRPPGHHAEHNRAMGFCIFNNIAVGAAHAMAHYGLERVAIVDFDVHHGNGTEDIFADEPRVLFCSTFQSPFYPFKGADTVSDHIINCPLPAGTDSQGFRAAVTDRWLPALTNFQPELLMISAGFDAHIADEMAHFRLMEADYTWVTLELRQIADQYAKGRIVSSLEGGYDLGALGRSVYAHLNALF